MGVGAYSVAESPAGEGNLSEGEDDDIVDDKELTLETLVKVAAVSVALDLEGATLFLTPPRELVLPLAFLMT